MHKNTCTLLTTFYNNPFKIVSHTHKGTVCAARQTVPPCRMLYRIRSHSSASLPAPAARIRQQTGHRPLAGQKNRYQDDQYTDHKQALHSVQIHYQPGIQQADDSCKTAVYRIRHIMPQIAEHRRNTLLRNTSHGRQQNPHPHIVEE